MIFSLCLAIFIFGLFLYDRRKHSFWKNRGICFPKTVPFFGNFFPVATAKAGSSQVYVDAYRQFPNENYVGVFEFYRPTLVVRDLKVVEKILVKDFSYFVDHPHWLFEDKSFMHLSTINITGSTWRNLRYHLAQSFTASRIKAILERIKKNYVLPPAGKIEMRNYVDTYAADAAAAFFGTYITGKQSFQNFVQEAMDVNLIRAFKLLTIEHFPRIAKLVGFKFLSDENDKHYRNTIKTFIKHDSEFKDILVNAKSRFIKNKTFCSDPYDELLEGQAAQYFIASLDTTSNEMAFLAYDLCMNPIVQEKAAKEVCEIFSKYGEFSYEALTEMKYLSGCIKETLRLHPTLPFLFRVATQDYTFDDGLILKKGDKIVIPSAAYQMDEKYFKDPNEYKPERWLDEENPINKFAWLPFGEGPRQCLGMRYAIIEMKYVFSNLLSNYVLKLNEKCPSPIKLKSMTIFTEMMDPLYIDLKNK